MRKPKPDDAVQYWSEPRTRGAEPGGPYPAKVVAVVKDSKDDVVDLIVEVAPGVLRSKTGVPRAESPTKHRWTWPKS